MMIKNKNKDKNNVQWDGDLTKDDFVHLGAEISLFSKLD